MAKLYPPILEGVLPAFYSDTIVDGEGEAIKITIPFSMNRAVSSTQVGGFALKIKTVQSSSYLYTAQVYNPLFYQLEDSTWVSITLHSNIEEENNIIQKLRVGQFYKFQLAYIKADENKKKELQDQYSKGIITLEEFDKAMSAISEIGHYSTVGIAKYTTKPIIHINDFKRGLINIHKYKYTGFYSQQNGDISERVYIYRFDVYDSMNKIIATSGDCLHNSSNDVELFESYDEFELNRDLEYNKNYYIKYTIITNNLLELSTPKYRIMQKTTVDPEIQADVKATLNYNNGYIDIALVGHKNEDGIEETVSGSFLLTRANSDNNYTNWEEISRFKLAGQFPSRWLWRDYTVEQGKSYQYSLQQYNDKDLYSNRLYSNIVYSDYEDAFLFDGERQLKIRYNPKVASFKATVQETKVNTIGSKHPFIFRNGRAYSHEFPISGLISYQMDEAHLFMDEYPQKDFRKSTHASGDGPMSMTDLTSENLSKERNFKLEVLEWLNNGKPKLFRSPSEGNYIIRLMNVSLTPNDSLGRMIHTFNSTAYEIADCTYENLAYYGFINLTDPEVPQLRWKTIEFNAQNADGTYKYRAGEILNNNPIYTVRFVDMIPGDMIHITFEDDTQEDIIIGITGSYYIDTGVPIRAVVLNDANIEKGRNLNRQGSMTYSYYSVQSNLFDKIDYVTVTEMPTQQFIGEHNVIQEIEYVYDSKKKQWLKNPKIDILEFYYIYASKRTTENIIYEDGKYWQDRMKTIEINRDNADPFSLYKVGYWTAGPGPSSEGNIGYNPGRQSWTFTVEGYEDFYNNKYYSRYDANKVEQYQPWLQVNNNVLSVNDTQVFDMNRPGKLQQLISGNGINLEVAYQVRNIDYNIENDESFPELIQAKQYYEEKVLELEKYFNAITEAGRLYQKVINAELNKSKELQDLESQIFQYSKEMQQALSEIKPSDFSSIEDYEKEVKNIQILYSTKISECEDKIQQINTKYNNIKANCEKEYNDYISNEDTFMNGTPNYEWEAAQRRLIKTAYTKYIIALIEAQEEERKAEGLL